MSSAIMRVNFLHVPAILGTCCSLSLERSFFPLLPNVFYSSFRSLVKCHFLREDLPDSPDYVRFPRYRLPDIMYFSASAQHSCTFVLVSSTPVSSTPVTVSDRAASHSAYCVPGYLLNTLYAVNVHCKSQIHTSRSIRSLS